MNASSEARQISLLGTGSLDSQEANETINSRLRLGSQKPNIRLEATVVSNVEMKNLKLFVHDEEYLMVPVAEADSDRNQDEFKSYNRFKVIKNTDNTADKSTHIILLPQNVWEQTSWFPAYRQETKNQSDRMNKLFCFLW